MIIDAHLDLAYNATLRDRDITQPAALQPIRENEIATVGLPDLRSAPVSCIFATIFCQPQTSKHAGYRSPDGAFAQAKLQLDYYDQLHSRGLLALHGRTPAAVRLDEITPIPTTLLLEGAESIRTPDDLHMMHQKGVRIVGLSWQRTRYAGGTATPGPLTPAGRDLVRQLDALSILHDASHLAERSFWDLIHATDRRIIASHSNCRSIVARDPNERHLTDAMIRAIAERDGVIGINFFDRFLLPAHEYGTRRAKLSDVIDHIKLICDLTGSDKHVGIGTDMDGGLGRDQIPEEIYTSADLPKIATALASAGFSPAAIQNILEANWARMIQAE